MENLGEFYQTADWKGEKHVPVIHVPEKIEKGDVIEVKLNIGEGVPHPNTFEHYISWMKLYFKPEGSKFPIEIGTFDFAAHGEYEIFTEPDVTSKFKAEKSGVLYASIYCNIHGLWENSKKITVE